MASTKTEMSEFLVDTLTTTPVILRGKEGVDYILKRVKTTGSNCKIRLLVAFETNDLDEVDVAGSDGNVDAIIPDTIFNRRAIEKDNNADWTYALAFASGTEIEIAIPINNIIVSLVWAASSGNINTRTALESAGSGKAKLHEASGRSIGKPLVIVATGTGDQIIAAVLFGMHTETLKA